MGLIVGVFEFTQENTFYLTRKWQTPPAEREMT
jgi:hypothetical protein